ncbi:MAG: T9SS type A sorting domain-containing protein [Paludibacter sp.]|nr:T9SS type A sorting domain-containing protein [Paludibacter sp.]
MRFLFSGILSLFFLFGIAVMNVHSQSNALMLKKTDGTDQTVAFTKLKKITFLGTNLVLNYQTEPTESISLASIRKMIFGTYTAVDRITVDNKDLAIYPNPSTDFIHVKAEAIAKSNIAIYSLSGTLVLSTTLTSIDEKIDVRGLQKGMYILKLENQAFKFTKL